MTNGGFLEFGPDGYLYISIGDGGSAGDPEKRAQDLSNLFGTIIRIDINTDSLGTCYSVVEGCMNDPSAFNYNDYTGDNITDDLTGINGVDINTDDVSM